MVKSQQLAFSGILSLAVLGWGCAVEQPYPAWTNPQELSPPFSVHEVIRLLKAGIREDTVYSWVRTHGITARPTTIEIMALREAGASNGFLAELLAAATPYVDESSSNTAREVRQYFWSPFHPFPGLGPYIGWTLQNGRWIPIPWPERIEP